MINCQNFNEFVDNCEFLKVKYEELLSPFFNSELISSLKRTIYSSKNERWKKDKMWEWLNGDLELEDLLKFKEENQWKRN